MKIVEFRFNGIPEQQKW